MNKKKIGIIGATGYTGSELVRLLVNHSGVSIELITSESKTDIRFSDIHPQFRGIMDIQLSSMKTVKDHELDLVFLALPHGISMEFVRDHINSNFKIIDLSGDFRLSSKEAYAEWYKAEHIFPEGLKKAVFGSPEFFREKIKTAHLIANPGCFVTSAILALAPLVKNNLIDNKSIIVDSKTGVSGAGVKATDVTHFDNVNDNFKPYGLKKHRHTIEMQEALTAYTGKELTLLFTPHLLPVDRGILTSVYAQPTGKIDEKSLRQLYANFYSKEPFVRVLDDIPSLKRVRGSNYCDIMVNYDERTNRVFVFSAIDNLVKGASGQAIQNMNLMLGLDESDGLRYAPLAP